MNAETRAKELYDRLFCIGEYRTAKVPIYPMAIIASALRQAENDKLEEAAKMADEHWCSTSRDGAHSMTFDHGPSLADLIRSLKSDQPLDIVKVGTAAFERGLNSKSKGTP